jgi:hypothetical protein
MAEKKSEKKAESFWERDPVSVIVGIMAVLVLAWLFLQMWFRSETQTYAAVPEYDRPAAPAEGDMTPNPGQLDQPVATVQPDIMDVTWDVDIYEMHLASGQTVSCPSIRLTVQDTGNGLRITTSQVDVLVTADQVKTADRNNDQWVKLTNVRLPNWAWFSVGYYEGLPDGKWKSDWRPGCPPALSTPVDP